MWMDGCGNKISRIINPLFFQVTGKIFLLNFLLCIVYFIEYNWLYCSHEIKKHFLIGRKVLTNLDSVLKKQRHYVADKDPYSQSYGFSSSHVQMWKLDHKVGWASENWCFQIVVLEKTVESPLDCKEIKLVNPKGNQPWIFNGRTDAEASIFCPSDAKSGFIGKDPDAGKD